MIWDFSKATDTWALVSVCAIYISTERTCTSIHKIKYKAFYVLEYFAKKKKKTSPLLLPLT